MTAVDSLEITGASRWRFDLPMMGVGRARLRWRVPDGGIERRFTAFYRFERVGELGNLGDGAYLPGTGWSDEAALHFQDFPLSYGGSIELTSFGVPHASTTIEVEIRGGGPGAPGAEAFGAPTLRVAWRPPGIPRGRASDLVIVPDRRCVG